MVYVCSVLGWVVSTLAWRQARGEHMVACLGWVSSHPARVFSQLPEHQHPFSSSSCADTVLVCVVRESVGSA